MIESLEASSPKRATVLSCGALLCAWEARTGPHTWRQHAEDTARYLGQMATWGYELSEIETTAAGHTAT